MQTVSVMYVSESEKIINAKGKNKSRMINLNLRGVSWEGPSSQLGHKLGISVRLSLNCFRSYSYMM